MLESLCKYSCCPEGNKFFKKEAPTQVLSCKYYKIFKNTFFKEYLQATASVPF